MSAQTAEEPATVVVPPQPGGLHKPWRAGLALIELLAAGGAVWAAFWCWPRGVTTITVAVPDGPEFVSTRFTGSWMAAAVGLGTLAALLVLDAIRQIVLAVRARPRGNREPR